ncbi:Hypothetical protein GbCGDNIH6_7237 [Granulibacter bethesdensis]|nr:Hypothetical protein GbCGDNIH6_7237 [Granulibacter bethesdensis]
MKPHSQYSCGAKRIVKTDNHNPVLMYLTHPKTDKVDLFPLIIKTKKANLHFHADLPKFSIKLFLLKRGFIFNQNANF